MNFAIKGSNTYFWYLGRLYEPIRVTHIKETNKTTGTVINTAYTFNQDDNSFRIDNKLFNTIYSN